LAALSNAKPEIAAYPFTTLHPSIGVIEFSDHNRITMADIPGLIEGAHEDRGLGHEFLKHIERTKVIGGHVCFFCLSVCRFFVVVVVHSFPQVLLYVLDGAGSENRQPLDDLKMLHNELLLYNENLVKKPALVFANKMDLVESETGWI
jgi:GTPase